LGLNISAQITGGTIMNMNENAENNVAPAQLRGECVGCGTPDVDLYPGVMDDGVWTIEDNFCPECIQRVEDSYARNVDSLRAMCEALCVHAHGAGWKRTFKIAVVDRDGVIIEEQSSAPPHPLPFVATLTDADGKQMTMTLPAIPS
jgi:hypothetical protein